jgi:magnesium transporter
MIEYLSKKAGAAVDAHEKFVAGDFVLVTAPTRAELRTLADEFKLDYYTVRDALDPEELPRFERVNNIDYLFARHAVKTGAFEVETKPFLVVMSPKFTILISATEPAVIKNLLADDAKFSTVERGEMILEILRAIFEGYSSNLKDVSRRVQLATDHLRHHRLERDDFVDFVVVEDDLAEILGALTPVPAILRRLVKSGESKILGSKHAAFVEDISLAIEQSVNNCNTDMRRIVSVREAYETLSNNSLNKSMKTLTILTLLVALPNVIFGMYGMNIALPFQHNPMAYFIVVLATIALVLFVVVVIRLKKF